MKWQFIMMVLMFTGNGLFAQPSIPQIDKSPLDISYFPDNYPMLKAQKRIDEPLVARLIYSRPGVQNRPVFGDLVPYGNVWRFGANEATEIEFFRNVKIGNSIVNQGRYTLYAIPYQDKWTLILNKDLHIWGSYIYDSKFDVLRMDLPVEKLPLKTENLAMYFSKENENRINLNAQWDSVKVKLPINLVN